MVVIIAEAYKNAQVHTITVGEKLFWVKMKDVQDGSGIKNISDILGKELRGMFATNSPTEQQKKKYIRSEHQITKNPIDDKGNKHARSFKII